MKASSLGAILTTGPYLRRASSTAQGYLPESLWLLSSCAYDVAFTNARTFDLPVIGVPNIRYSGDARPGEAGELVEVYKIDGTRYPVRDNLMRGQCESLGQVSMEMAKHTIPKTAGVSEYIRASVSDSILWPVISPLSSYFTVRDMLRRRNTTFSRFESRSYIRQRVCETK